MEILKINDKNKDKAILNAINVMAEGGVVLYPTDTVYGLGANIFNKLAVRRVFDIKHRNHLKPLSILVSNTKAISHVANLQNRDLAYINKYLPGSYTLILRKSDSVPGYVTGGLQYVGVRVPDNEIACSIAKIFPITTTSANLTDCETLETPEEILNQINQEVDLVLDVGPLKNNKPSTIINLSGDGVNFVER